MLLDIFNFHFFLPIHLYKNAIGLSVWATCIFNFSAEFISSTFEGK